MESKVKLLGHPVHQILVAFPLGLLTTAALFDAVHVLGGSATWSLVAFYIIGAGVAGGLLAAFFGMADYLAIPAGTRAKRVGGMHGLMSVTVVLIFAVGWTLRRPDPGDPSMLALACSLGGAALLGLAGWLGGELLNRMGVGIDDGAHLDADASVHLPTRRRVSVVAGAPASAAVSGAAASAVPAAVHVHAASMPDSRPVPPAPAPDHQPVTLEQP